MTKVIKTTTDDGSYIHNCLIKPRQDKQNDPCVIKGCSGTIIEGSISYADAMFTVPADESRIIVKLDGYAIIPIEEYEELLTRDIKPD